jgi:predicted LPLAT superfamily acyltransferase
VDRHAFLLDKAKHISYSFDNEQALIDIKDKNKGAVLLSGHIGNWETAGNLLKDRISNKINALMLDAEYQKIKQFIDNSTGGSKFNVIAIKNDLSHIIKIKNALSNNEFIAIHADRTTEGIKNIEIDFFRIPTKFPYGPFLIASKFKVPVVFVFAVKGNENHYSLNCTNPTVGKSPEEIAKKYVVELERMVRKYPEQWFNYYNYFEQ